ncbi:MAG: 2-dehydro-3-deoxygalactonokinase [Acidobacteria bacterium]|nr:2-dehydro-3-deoxygalactonokinase [Acidobacteriota bacterium]
MNDSCTIYVDTGTTNTRVWLVCGERIISRASAMVGVRDTARDGTPARLRASLGQLITEVLAVPEAQECEPEFVAAAGMITSSLGLAEVPHIPAPAGISELSAAVRRYDFPDITHLEVLLVPGVRTGPQEADLNTIESADLMRGEETMCLGLLASELATAPCTVINLGSHWKVISIDASGRISGSTTSLSGEMIHTTQTQTILASAVPQTRPESLDPHWVESGMLEQRKTGLARALFCVRLLEQGRQSTSEERFAFMIGSFIASDLDPLIAHRAIDGEVIITGGGPIAKAWQRALARESLNATVIPDGELERALLRGLDRITSWWRYRDQEK